MSMLDSEWILPHASLGGLYMLGGYRVFVYWMLLTGIAVKLPFVWYVTGLSWVRSTIADLAINGASLFARTLMIPVLTIVKRFCCSAS